MANNNQKTVGWIEMSVAMFFCMAVLVMLWVVFRGEIGILYRAARSAETLGLWRLSSWGGYFTGTPPKEYALHSIFISSVPFGVLFAGIVVLIGFIMTLKVQNKHIITQLRPEPDADVAMGWDKLMDRFAPLYPHNEFFLKFPMYRYSSTRGPASQPMSALELLIDCGAIEVEKNAEAADDDKPDAKKSGEHAVNRARIREALETPFGELNPLLGIDLRNEAPVKVAVDNLSWYAATILYAALVRVNALHDQLADIKETVDKSEEYLRDVWRAINAEKKQLGDKLVIGPFDYPDPRKKSPPKKKKKGLFSKAEPIDPSKAYEPETPEGMVLFVDHMKKAGPTFETTKKAREGLVKLLINPSKGIDPKKPVDVIARIVQGHGFVFGMLASSLTDGKSGTVEAARATGVMAPNTFLWLRFVDRSLWRFLNYVGMQTPCPEAAGMFDHWQMELVLKAARMKPEIAETTITAIVQEARKLSPEALTARDFDTLRKKVAQATTSPIDEMMRSSKLWNDDSAPAPSLTPEA